MGIATLTTPRLRPSAAGPGAGSRVVVSTRAVVSTTPQSSSSFRRAKPPGARLTSRARWGLGADALIRPGVAGGQPVSRAPIASAPRPRAQRPARCATRPIYRPIDLPCALSPKPQTDPSALREFSPPSTRAPPGPANPANDANASRYIPINHPRSSPTLSPPVAASPPVLTRPRAPTPGFVVSLDPQATPTPGASDDRASRTAMVPHPRTPTATATSTTSTPPATAVSTRRRSSPRLASA